MSSWASASLRTVRHHGSDDVSDLGDGCLALFGAAPVVVGVDASPGAAPGELSFVDAMFAPLDVGLSAGVLVEPGRVIAMNFTNDVRELVYGATATSCAGAGGKLPFEEPLPALGLDRPITTITDVVFAGGDAWAGDFLGNLWRLPLESCE